MRRNRISVATKMASISGHRQSSAGRVKGMGDVILGGGGVCSFDIAARQRRHATIARQCKTWHQSTHRVQSEAQNAVPDHIEERDVSV